MCIELRPIQDYKLIISNNRAVAKLVGDGVLLGKAQSIMADIVAMDEVDFNQAMIAVNSMKDIEDILQWHKLIDMKRLVINAYCVIDSKKLFTTMGWNISLYRNLDELLITGPNQIDDKTFLEIAELIPAKRIQILGSTLNR